MKQTLTTFQSIEALMLSMKDEAQAKHLSRFFKTGEGQYGAGDQFLGIKVPQVRAIAKDCTETPLPEIHQLLSSPWHEIRLCGFLILVAQMKRQLPGKRKTGDAEERNKLITFYLDHAPRANNWDLVDLSCSYILGEWLMCPQADGNLPDSHILDRLAQSTNLWEQRIAIVSNWTLIRTGRLEETLRIASALMNHPHDLIHKAVGWMLREVGKKDIGVLRSYLHQYASSMPRTMLRYAIEKMEPEERAQWLSIK